MPAANQLSPRLGRGSRDHETSDQREKGKEKPSKFLLLQKAAHKHHSPPGMLLVVAALKVSADSPAQQAGPSQSNRADIRNSFPWFPEGHLFCLTPPAN